MRYPGADWEPFPENATQPSIHPTQVIHHVTSSIGAISGTWKYFELSTVRVESHFGIDYEDIAWQGIDDEIRADANLLANRRPDGTGAISVETRGGEFGYWTAWQIDWLVAHGVWCHDQHGIPLRICRTPDDPGFGYHTLFGAPSAWTPVVKSCPGPNRITQWRDIVFPRIEAKDVSGPMTQDEINAIAAECARRTARAVWDHNIVDRLREDIPDVPDGTTERDAQAFLQALRTKTADQGQQLGALESAVAELKTLILANAALSGQTPDEIAASLAIVAKPTP